MKFFIDTANVDEIKKAYDFGLVDGVTTNPSLVAKENKPLKDLIPQILDSMTGVCSVEVIGTTTDEMLEDAKKYIEWGDRIVIKLPLTMDGLRACRNLTEQEIKTNVTLCFSANQALLAAKAGATYISPFVGRLDDISEIGMNLIEDISTIYDNYGYETNILVASIRNPTHVLESALIGADVATIPFSVMTQLCKHPLTDIGIERFLSDWGKLDA